MEFGSDATTSDRPGPAALDTVVLAAGVQAVAFVAGAAADLAFAGFLVGIVAGGAVAGVHSEFGEELINGFLAGALATVACTAAFALVFGGFETILTAPSRTWAGELVVIAGVVWTLGMALAFGLGNALVAAVATRVEDRYAGGPT